MASRHTQKLYTVSTLRAPKGHDPNKPISRFDCGEAPVAKLWAGTGSDAIAMVRDRHPELGRTMLVVSAAHLGPDGRVLQSMGEPNEYRPAPLKPGQSADLDFTDVIDAPRPSPLRRLMAALSRWFTGLWQRITGKASR